MIANRRAAVSTAGPEFLLPWLATGQLSRPESSKIDLMLAQDAELARTFAGVQKERDTIVALNDRLGAPSPRVLLALFAAIDLDIAAREKSA